MEKSNLATRNHGIDLLKILAMFMVIILHVLGKGGVLNAVSADATPPNFIPPGR